MGMSTDNEGIFTPTDKALARGYWYAIITAVGVLALARMNSVFLTWSRLRRPMENGASIPSRPANWLEQIHATSMASLREMSYAQPVYFTGRISKYFTPLPVGKWLVLCVYWTMLLIMLWSNAIMKPTDPMYVYKWERVGFRAAWVTVSQIPFIYLLSMRFSPLTGLSGISYERINWLHRWAARTVFLTASVHWSFFLREWWLADIVQMEMQMMPMVKYGLGAFGIIAWMVLSGFGLFRAMSYEIFVVQHIVAAGVLPWLLFMHVPAYARYNIWMSIAFTSFDWSMRITWNTLRNLHILGRPVSQAPGYRASLQPLAGDMVRVTIQQADFKWRAGQHIYLSVPRLRPLELHPFTIANASVDARQAQSLTMVIKARSGFSRSLSTAARRTDAAQRSYRALLSGPWGNPPDLRVYDTVILIACASGASFTTPLLTQVVSTPHCVRKVIYHWIIRDDAHVSWLAEALEAALSSARSSGVYMQIVVHITRASMPIETASTSPSQKAATQIESQPASEQGSSSISLPSFEYEKASLTALSAGSPSVVSMCRAHDRPNTDALIRQPVEAALGETAVVVCGGTSITAQARTCVAALSDERGVHKGTGAQGIFLFTETYGW